jgi:hypothetical protein
VAAGRTSDGLQFVPAAATAGWLTAIDVESQAEPLSPRARLSTVLHLDGVDGRELIGLDAALGSTTAVFQFGGSPVENGSVLVGSYDRDEVRRSVIGLVGDGAMDDGGGNGVITLRWPDGSGVAITETEVAASPSSDVLEQLVVQLEGPGGSVADSHPAVAEQLDRLFDAGASTVSVYLDVPDAEPHRLRCGLGCSNEQAEELIREIDAELVGDLRHKTVAIGSQPTTDEALVLLGHEDPTDAARTATDLPERVSRGHRSLDERPWDDVLAVVSVEQDDRFVLATFSSRDPQRPAAAVIADSILSRDALVLPWDAERAIASLDEVELPSEVTAPRTGVRGQAHRIQSRSPRTKTHVSCGLSRRASASATSKNPARYACATAASSTSANAPTRNSSTPAAPSIVPSTRLSATRASSALLLIDESSHARAAEGSLSPTRRSGAPNGKAGGE